MMFNQFGVTMNSKKIEVSVIVPILNEENYISEFLDSIVKQDYDKSKMEVILVDGVSTDNTRKIILDYCKKYDFIYAFTNKKRNIPVALNIGISKSKGSYIVRMDAHTYYYPDYISQCMNIIKSTGYQNVGGPTVVGHKSYIQKIISAAHYSPFALGGGKQHNIGYEGLTDTVSFGVFNRDYILSLGMYDENIQFAEDDDLNFRIKENGGSVFISPKIKFIYYPRNSFKSLFIQYFKYGLWKVAVIKKHKRPARLSHLVPVFFVLFLIIFPVLSLFSNIASFVFSTVVSIYLFLCALFSFKNKKLDIVTDKLILIFTHFVLHISYGLGFLYGIFKFFNKKFKNKKIEIEKYRFQNGELRSLQMKSLDLMVRFKKFCYDHNLKFFLCGGGCIGAVRHSGFIPWDDDLDVFMPRDDYEILSKFDYSKESFTLIRSSDKTFSGQTFTVVSDKSSTLIKKEHIGLRIPRGVSVDIFPLDGCPDSWMKQKIQMIYACFFSLFTAKISPQNHGKLLCFISSILLSIIFGDKLRFKIASFCEKQMSKYKISNCKFVKELCAGPKYMRNVYDKKIFDSFILKKFENVELPVPIGYDEYLRTAFGNYMELPPKEQQVNSHDIVFLDLENSYEKYRNQF